MANVSRRTAIKTLGGAALTTGLTLAGAAAQQHTTTAPTATPSAGADATAAGGVSAPPKTYLFLNAEEPGFVT
jgi:hypothetical protein